MQEDRPAFAGQWHGANGANPEADAGPLPGVAEAKAFMEERADELRALAPDGETVGGAGVGAWMAAAKRGEWPVLWPSREKRPRPKKFFEQPDFRAASRARVLMARARFSCVRACPRGGAAALTWQYLFSIFSAGTIAAEPGTPAPRRKPACRAWIVFDLSFSGFATYVHYSKEKGKVP